MTATYTMYKSKIRRLDLDDEEFHIRDGWALVPRAMLHVTPDCPKEYKDIINRCVSRGWLKPVAHMTDNELMWENLSE